MTNQLHTFQVLEIYNTRLITQTANFFKGIYGGTKSFRWGLSHPISSWKFYVHLKNKAMEYTVLRFEPKGQNNLNLNTNSTVFRSVVLQVSTSHYDK